MVAAAAWTEMAAAAAETAAAAAADAEAAAAAAEEVIAAARSAPGTEAVAGTNRSLARPCGPGWGVRPCAVALFSAQELCSGRGSHAPAAHALTQAEATMQAAGGRDWLCDVTGGATAAAAAEGWRRRPRARRA
mmetsp:Transcript_26604/g.55252  ORF Transcript_26604/g.55252 Transcript_26604/m.55252 type:complete len:134 (-) Transcript_26604:644-1045(-)